MLLMIRVAVVNDGELVVRGVAAMLRRHQHMIEVVQPELGEPVDVALYETSSARGERAPGLAELVADPYVAKVAVYTWSFQPWLAQDILANGAAGYLSKGLSAAQLLDALLRIHAGHDVVAPAAADSQRVGSHWAGQEAGLTIREAQVLSFITMGLSNQEIAARTYLSLNSIKSYIRHCYRKIGVDKRSKAVVWGVVHGLRPEGVDLAQSPVQDDSCDAPPRVHLRQPRTTYRDRGVPTALR